jgi:glycosyltransferase involved in cell wall biosynthesis
MTLATGGHVDVSVLVPAKDEAENLPEFLKQCKDALGEVPYSCEVVVVNDGSEDDTAAVLERLRGEHPFLTVVTHRARRGIADALRSAGEVARGDIFVFYPADLQFLPAEIPRLVEPVRAGEADIVTGTKQGEYEKAFVSGVYNLLCRWLFGLRVTDLNAVKAYRREVMAAVPARPDWHRFMVVIAATDGYEVTERPVTLLPRRAGKSKFGIGRIPVGAMDLLSVWFQLRFGRKPLLFFGVSGAILFLLGFLVGVAALVLRFGYGLGFRPLLDLVMVLVISGIALFGFGFIGDMLAGTREELRSVGRSVEQLVGELKRERSERTK